MLGTVENASEFNAFGLDLAQVLQAPHLESTAVRKHGAIPAHELVNATCCSDFRRCGAQVQMVRVREDNLRFDVFLELRGRHGLYGCFGAHRHKNRSLDVAVVGVQNTQTGLGFLRRLFQFKTIHVANVEFYGVEEKGAITNKKDSIFIESFSAVGQT